MSKGTLYEGIQVFFILYLNMKNTKILLTGKRHNFILDSELEIVNSFNLLGSAINGEKRQAVRKSAHAFLLTRQL